MQYRYLAHDGLRVAMAAIGAMEDRRSVTITPSMPPSPVPSLPPSMPPSPVPAAAKATKPRARARTPEGQGNDILMGALVIPSERSW